MFHVLLLERDVTRREAVDQKIANQLKFEEGEQPEQEIDLILDSMIFAEKAVNSRPPRLYYLIYWKGETYSEDTWEPIETVFHLRQLLKKYHSENPEKPTAASPSIDKGAPPSLMAARSGQNSLLLHFCLLALLCANILLRISNHPCESLLCWGLTNTQLSGSAAATNAENLRPGLNTLHNTYAQRIPCKS